MKPLVVGYFADGPWAHDAFDRIIADPSIRIAFVCLRFSRPDDELRRRAERAGIDVFTHPRINSDEFRERVASYACDLFVSMSFDQIFRKPLFTLPPLHTINCHAGKLPFYRGRNILNWALINDEPDFGITVHYVDEGIDTGDIVVQETFPIGDDDDYATLLERAHHACAELLVRAIKAVQDGSAPRIRQSEIHPLGSYCSTRRPGDERLDWNQTSRDVFNFVRAICAPGPEARTFRDADEIRINRVQWLPDAPNYKGIPGAVIGKDANGILVKTADSYVRLVEWSGVDSLRIGDRLT